MENELYSHNFIGGWGDFHVIKVYKKMIIYEIINWGDVDFIEPSWDREECTHQLFYNYHKNDEKFKPVIEFLLKENMIDTKQK